MLFFGKNKGSKKARESVANDKKNASTPRGIEDPARL